MASYPDALSTLPILAHIDPFNAFHAALIALHLSRARRLPYMPPSSLAQPPEVGASERSPSQAKEHFIPPTGGGFRTKPPRRKRPSTADCTGSKPRDSLRCDFAPCQALAA
ncbi:unnamed protein product [Effrenium voratum]|nr:unnamed protein product [Effrenium voratum]